jgi:hypothetical protein
LNREKFGKECRGYLSRGHCLMELMTSKLPRIDVFQKWYIPGIDIEGEWGHVTVYYMHENETQRMSWTDFCHSGSPVAGVFTIEEDRLLIRPLVLQYLNAFDDFYLQCLLLIRNATSWKEIKDISDKLPIQLLGIPMKNHHLYELGKTSIDNPYKELFQTPAEFVDYILPIKYLEMIKESIKLGLL